MRLPWQRREVPVETIERSHPPLALNTWASYFTYGGLAYGLGGRQTLLGDREEAPTDFVGLVQSCYKANGIVFACMAARSLPFSEARFAYRRLRNGRPQDLFTSRELGILEHPWPGATTGDLLSRAIQDVDLAGNSYWTSYSGDRYDDEGRLVDPSRRRDRLARLRPDWTSILLGSDLDGEAAAWDVNAEVVGYVYRPGGAGSGAPPVIFERDEVAHFLDTPDPLAMYRGMSWIQPVVREILGDKAATAHKLKFFEQGATPNLVVSLDIEDLDKFNSWVEAIRDSTEGVENAYKTLVLGAGSDVKVAGADFQQIEFKATQGAGETRIAAAAQVPPVIVGLSEGLAAATYSNYAQARRRFADGTLRPLWRKFAGSLETIVPTPPDAQLWYDDRDVPYLQEDVKDEAEIQKTRASTLQSLISSGFTPESAVRAVDTGDFSQLKHTGLVSVQLLPPGTTGDGGAEPSDQGEPEDDDVPA